MLQFLKYIAKKDLSLTEYPVLTIVYMDTRFKQSCQRTIRGFLENSPFDMSVSSVANALNSLTEKGYIKKKIIGFNKLCYVAIGVKSEDSIISEVKPETVKNVSKPKQKQKPKRKTASIPPERNVVKEHMRKYYSKRYGEVPEDFIETQTEMFFAYYEQIDWEIGKTKKKMKNVALACSGWVLRDKSFIQYKNSVNTVPALSVQPVTIDEIISCIYAIYEPMQFRSDWKNNRVENLIEEQARAFYAQMTKKNWKLNVGCQTWQDQLQVFAADMYCPLRFLNPDYVTKNKQEREARNELLTGFKNCDPFNRNSVETLKMILEEK